MSEIATEILIVFLLICANSIFALSEMAIISARKTSLQQRAEDRDKGAETALALAHEPTRFLSTVQVGMTSIGILSGAVGGVTMAEETTFEANVIRFNISIIAMDIVDITK